MGNIQGLDDPKRNCENSLKTEGIVQLIIALNRKRENG